jgi:hypothetical protein
MRTHPTLKELAREHGVSLQTLKRYRAQGVTPDKIVLRTTNLPKPVIVKGVSYKSHRAAARALGIPAHKVALLFEDT